MGIMNIFIKPEEKKETVTSEAVPEEKEESAEKQVEPQTILVSDGAEISLEVKDKLWKTLNDRNISGPDMLEMISYAASLEPMGMNPEQRYEAAFKILKAQYPDFTRRSLLNSIDVYIEYLKEELRSGERQFDAKRQSEIVEKQQEVEFLTTTLASIMKQIETLKANCDALSSKISAAKEGIEASEKSISHDYRIFVNTVYSVIHDLEKEKQAMSKIEG